MGRAQQLSFKERKWNDFFPVKELHGVIPITETSDLFYWLFPSRNDPDNDPLVIWLTGGPGCSSELAIFFENGPMEIKGGQVKINPYSWNTKANLLFVDQPIGTGFSKAGKGELPKNEEEVAEHFGIFIGTFLKQFPEYIERRVFITGESYAGHYIPHIANYLSAAEFRAAGFNLIGIAIGNGWVDPYNQFPGYASFGFNNRLISRHTKVLVDIGVKFCQLLLRFEVPKLKLTVCDYVQGLVQKFSLKPNFNVYDVRRTCDYPPLCYDMSEIYSYVSRRDVREALGVADREWSACNPDVYSALQYDIEISAAPKVASLLHDGFKVLVYSGDKDYICNWEGGLNWVTALPWAHQREFEAAPIINTPVGQTKTFANFEFFRVYNAGHMVPYDQPQVSLDMLDRFISFQKAVTSEL